MRNKQKNQGITLIALVITIIILIILATVSIFTIFGENGVINKAKLAKFGTEMQKIKENVVIKQNKNAIDIAEGKVQSYELFNVRLNENEIEIVTTLKQQILYTREGYPTDKTPDDYTDEDFRMLVDTHGNVYDMYIIDKKTGDGKENTYIWDNISNIVFKIPQTKIGEKIYHSYEIAQIYNKKDMNNNEDDQKATEESEVNVIDEEYYYGPNMKGFNLNKTDLIYYSENYEEEISIPIREYLDNGQQHEIERNGKKYTLHNIKKHIWANAKTTGNGLECWWVWIPRYAYKVNDTSVEPPIDIIFIGLNNKPLNPKYNEVLPEGYIVHPAFTPSGKDGSKNLKGIWMSKYSPSYSLGLPDQDECYPPDMTGFDPDYTYIELFDGTDFTEEVKLADANLNTINNENKWYDYRNKIWANVKTTGNGLECWWVWIPRYAYQITEGIAETSIIFIDLNNKPIDKATYGENLPKDFIVHPAFTPSGNEGSKNLKGIWMSKYAPSFTQDNIASSSQCYEPDMEGFDPNYTYIELFDGTDFTEEVKLSDANLSTINNENKWHDYRNKIWANIKTTGNGLECWWVWIPRFAYQITEGLTETNIVFIDLNNKPIDKATYGENLPKDFIVHPAFTPSGEEGSKNLKGIWMSKYAPSWTSHSAKDDSGEITAVDTPKDGSTLEYPGDISATFHEHVGNGAGTKLVHVSNTTDWCTAHDVKGTPCSNDGYKIYCSLCGARLKGYWCAAHYNTFTKVFIDD